MVYGLTRLLRTEDDWSDLLCFLAELDPEPLRSALRLTPGTITIRRESRVKAHRAAPAGRLDFVILLDDTERAVMEVKLGASAHGEQFAAYDAWADVIGIPMAERYVVGLNHDPIPGVPSTWSHSLTIASLLGGWHTSGDDLARLLSDRALQQLEKLEAEVTGPANQASTVLSDALRLRRLVAQTQAAAPPGTVFEKQQRSRSGAANVCAWRQTHDGYVLVEIQRLVPKRGTDTPFEIRIMVQTPEATAAANGALADRHRAWLARHSFVRHAGPAVRRLVVAPDADGFKSGGPRRGHPTYYGYKDGGHGSSVVLDSAADLNDMVTAYSAALSYLTTYKAQ
ncbi:hypothetical protein GCM10022403_087250 [Streptomyces coacervatus]|uniref:PD-(D/E)XK nuclease superfamily protein n=1 Tax=Streptomyces coacervatus TaxID=647381 RepID=A0ABP7JD24_9ACTN|nr:hypothetical protein [Streptomyces coacervatus]MDF2273388.1 hypothetical protein [Streptomyces coacervatus]